MRQTRGVHIMEWYWLVAGAVVVVGLGYWVYNKA